LTGADGGGKGSTVPNHSPGDNSPQRTLPAPAGHGAPDARLHLDLDKSEGHPTTHAEVTLHVWLLGTLRAKTPSMVMIPLVGCVTAGAIMVVAITNGSDLRVPSAVAISIVLVTSYLVRRSTPAGATRRRRPTPRRRGDAG
jgi:hypothetical protein